MADISLGGGDALLLALFGERFPVLLLQSISPYALGLKSSFELSLSPLMHKPDMEQQASLP